MAPWRIKSRILIAGAGLTLVLASCAGGGGGDNSQAGSSQGNGSSPSTTSSAKVLEASCDNVKGSAEGATIAYMPPGLEFPYYIGIGHGVKMQAKKLGYKTFTLGPESGSDYAKQASMMRDVIHRGVDGIIFHTHNNAATAPILKQAVQQGIAVVMVNSDILSFPTPIHAVVGYKEHDADVKAGEYAVKLMHGNAKIGIIEGLPGYDSTQRVQGFLDGIKGSSGMQVVAKENGKWNVPGGHRAALDMLQAHPEINLVFAANDYMAEGTLKAAQALHRTNVKIIGSDGDTSALEDIHKKTQYMGTVNTIPVQQGEIAMKVMRKCLQHKSGKFYVETPTKLVTRDNVLSVLKDWKELWPKPSHRY
ncbi:MAG: sugar ABC transporter substrate-binding protein [Streptosporangiaceae bacterium]